jgi:glyoxylase-like metal-dependent hydrolase (beta-lactamase superfamily II)
MVQPAVHALDLDFQGRKQAIGVYLIPHANGAALVESGPGSTIEAVRDGLRAHGCSISDVTDVFLTHIHLDHAGAAGWFARQGARVYVHPNGAAHMLNPEKLIASATRIYGDKMDTLWGEFLPVPEDKLIQTQDDMLIDVGGLRVRVVETPGHAEHHNCYLFEDICFSGDIAGIRMPGFDYVSMPFVPPELHFPRWRASVEKLQRLGLGRIAPTHFGVFDDPDAHLQTVLRALDSAERWLESVMPSNPTVEELRVKAVEWQVNFAHESGADDEVLKTYEIANPTGMAGDGMYRYWHKVRMAG